MDVFYFLYQNFNVQLGTFCINLCKQSLLRKVDVFLIYFVIYRIKALFCIAIVWWEHRTLA